jgi:hypothetical protein
MVCLDPLPVKIEYAECDGMGACNRQNNTASRVDERSVAPGGPTCEVQSIMFPDINVSTNN